MTCGLAGRRAVSRPAGRKGKIGKYPHCAPWGRMRDRSRVGRCGPRKRILGVVGVPPGLTTEGQVAQASALRQGWRAPSARTTEGWPTLVERGRTDEQSRI